MWGLFIACRRFEAQVLPHLDAVYSYPQPAAGVGNGPVLLKVTTDELPKMLGITSMTIVKHPRSLELSDATLS